MEERHVETIGIYPLKINKRNTRRVLEICPKSTIQTPERHHWHYSVAIIVNPVPISHRAAVSTFWHQADKCRLSRYFLVLEIKQNLRILTVKQISHSQTKFTYPKFHTKSLQSLQSHPSSSHLLILFLKSSRFFKFLISIGTICQTFEAKNLEFRPYLLLFTKFLKKSGWVRKLYFINLGKYYLQFHLKDFLLFCVVH